MRPSEERQAFLDEFVRTGDSNVDDFMSVSHDDPDLLPKILKLFTYSDCVATRMSRVRPGLIPKLVRMARDEGIEMGPRNLVIYLLGQLLQYLEGLEQRPEPALDVGLGAPSLTRPEILDNPAYQTYLTRKSDPLQSNAGEYVLIVGQTVRAVGPDLAALLRMAREEGCDARSTLVRRIDEDDAPLEWFTPQIVDPR
jgi:hypothetical protein